MGILDKLKKKKESVINQKPSSDNVLDMVKEQTEPKKDKKPVKLKESTGDAYRILIRPQLSEKSSMLAHSGKYVFHVAPSANKPQVASAIERVYDVHVERVNIINLSGKARRYGRTTGRTINWKKAIVTLKEGERIEGIVESV